MSSIIKVDTIQDQDGNNIINENANTITIGASGDTISIPSGATLANSGTATGFGISWQSDIKTSAFTAVAGEGYFCNTTSSAFTVTLPGSASAGDTIQIVDYAGTFDTNKITLTSSLNIEGSGDNKFLSTEREGVTITYVDVTQGWLATSGVNEGSQALDPTTYSADFLVVAGGGGGGYSNGGGGGAGGFRISTQNLSIGAVYTVTVGDGGSGGSPGSQAGTAGTASSISGSGITTISSAGGGSGGASPSAGGNGGSGGGGGNSQAGGTGNTPSVSPSQGNNGGSAVGSAAPSYGAAGGGGAGAVGSNGTGSSGGNGGNGSASSITGSSVTYAGGGGGSSDSTQGSGGTGGGGGAPGTAGTANTGGGGGGCKTSGGPNVGGAGGKGVVILSVPTASYSGTTTGSPTVTTSGSNTIMQFNGSGSYTA